MRAPEAGREEPAALCGARLTTRPFLRGFRNTLKRHSSADEILQCRLIDLVAFVDIDGAPDIPAEAGVE